MLILLIINIFILNTGRQLLWQTVMTQITNVFCAVCFKINIQGGNKCDELYVCFVTLPYRVLLYLIVSIPNRGIFPYFQTKPNRGQLLMPLQLNAPSSRNK